ncbi:hypothetical protein J4477_01075 [Candidatus Pacearchaeota archaeon]|nr:hypothetical protein [Candidatus Pacearchaeota archaeon]
MKKIIFIAIFTILLISLAYSQNITDLDNTIDINEKIPENLQKFFESLTSTEPFVFASSQTLWVLTGIKDQQPLNIIIISFVLFLLMIYLMNEIVKFSSIINENSIVRIITSIVLVRIISFNGTFNKLSEIIFSFVTPFKILEENPILRLIVTLIIIIFFTYGITQTVKHLRIQSGREKSEEKAFVLGSKLKSLLKTADTFSGTKP